MSNGKASCRPAPSEAAVSSPEGELSRKLKACSVIAYSEATLLRLPFTGVYAPNETGVTSVCLEAGDAPFSQSERRWTVRSSGLTLPGTFARRVFRALEWIAIDESIAHGKPFQNPILVSPRDICERLCWHPHQEQLEAIDEALQALAAIEIVPAGTPRGTRRSAGSPEAMKLLNVVASGIIKNAGGKVGFSNFKISFDERFVASINRGNVVALNWAAWSAVEDPVAQRLMEVLESESSQHPESPVIAMNRRTLYRLIPMSPARSQQARHELLDQAHQELIRAEYIESVASPASASPDLLLYRPGIAWHALRLQHRAKPAVDIYQRMMERNALGQRTDGRLRVSGS